MTPRLRQFLLAGLLAPVIGGCTSPAVDAWVASEMVHLTDKTARFDGWVIFDPLKREMNLFAAGNETVSFQLVVDSPRAASRGIRIEWSDLRSAGGARIPAANIRAFRMIATQVAEYPPWYLRLVPTPPGPAGFYDALVPIEADDEEFDLAKGERLAVWVDLYVPRRAKPGRYIGKLKVTAARHKSWSAIIVADVYDFVLPDSRPIAAVGGFDHTSLFGPFIKRGGKSFAPVHLNRDNPLVREGLVLMRQLMRLGHQHRLDLFDKQIRPLLKRDRAGKVELLWEDYDAIVTPYVTGTAFADRVGCQAWPMPFSEDWPAPANYGGIATKTYASVAAAVVEASRDHFSHDEQTSRADHVSGRMFVWPYRGSVDNSGYARHVRLAKIVRGADLKTPILTQLPPEPPKLSNLQPPADFRKLANIFAPPPRWLEADLASQPTGSQDPLAGVWLSPGQPPYLPSLGVIATPADVRAIPWFAMKYNCTGLFLPETLNWADEAPRAAAIAETRLFYPHPDAAIKAVVPSVRLKRLRRGLQDITYLWLLQLRDREAVAKIIINAMTRYGGLAAAGDNYLDPRLDGWVRDGATWQMARRLMAEEVQAAVHPEDTSKTRQMKQRLAWKQFDDKTRTLRIEQIRSRVTPVKPAASGADRSGQLLRATVSLELYNEYSRAVDVLIKIDDLPQGWQPAGPADRIVRMPTATRRVVELAVQGSGIPTDASAKMSVAISIAVDSARPAKIVAQVPLLRCGAAVKAPRIDGVLDDWPMRAGNCGGNFKLLGRRGKTGSGLARRQTKVFVTNDSKNLYFAFRCEEPTPAAMLVRPNNIIHYEQLMACGEDLVEIILDPGAKAAKASDLYHIAVKPNGVIITERGVKTDPPLGATRPWPAGASVAVGRQDGFWIVELAVPLASFGAAGNEPCWAVNFTRFATQGAEASSWSGASRHFYDQRNLGTMLLAPTDPAHPAGGE